MRARTADAIGEIEARKRVNAERERAYEQARERYHAAVDWMDRTWEAAVQANVDAKAKYRRLLEAYLAKLRALNAGLTRHDRDSAEDYFGIVVADCVFRRS